MTLEPLLCARILAPSCYHNFDRHPDDRHIRLGLADNEEDGIAHVLGQEPPGVVNEVEPGRGALSGIEGPAGAEPASIPDTSASRAVTMACQSALMLRRVVSCT